jgi:hypothetical protein
MTEDTSMVKLRSGSWRLPHRATAVAALLLAFAANPAQARQVLLVCGYGNTIGKYDATTSATINATLIGAGQGLSLPIAMVVDGSNHLFVANANNNTVGQYDATTGAAINAAFINGQGLNDSSGMALDRSNHLLVGGIGNSIVGQYNATTGATVNVALITEPLQGRNMVLDGTTTSS